MPGILFLTGAVLVAADLMPGGWRLGLAALFLLASATALATRRHS